MAEDCGVKCVWFCSVGLRNTIDELAALSGGDSSGGGGSGGGGGGPLAHAAHAVGEYDEFTSASFHLSSFADLHKKNRVVSK